MFERILKQPVMNRVLYSLIPVTLFSVYLFGWRSMAVVLTANFAAYISEYMFIRKKRVAR